MIGSCTYNVDTNVESNNIVINNAEMNNNKKTTGVNIITYAIIGASLLNLSANNNKYDYYEQNSFEITSSQRFSQDISSVSVTIDLLKIENINKINKIKEFDNDWNGNGAEKFSTDSINMFIEVINELVKQPKIAPTGKDSLLMQYEKENNSLLAFNVTYGRVEKAYIPNGIFEQAETDVYTEDICDKMNQCVEKFYES